MSKTFARRDPKGNTRTPFAVAPDDQHPTDAAYIPPTPLEEAIWDTTLKESLLYLLALGDGWVRITSELSAKNIYLKYKWKSGRYQGHYVMAVCTPDNFSWGVGLLKAKVDQVYAGVRTPATDRPYE